MTASRLSIRATSLAAAAASIVAAMPAAAQINATPRSLGMGGAYVAAARGAEALFQNPANLALPDSPRWSFFLPQVTVGARVTGFEAGDVGDLFKGSDLTQSRRDELLAQVPAQGTDGQLNVRIPVAALQIGRFAIGLSAAGVGDHSAGRDLVELALNGYERGRTDYDVGNTGGRSAAFADLVAAYGFRVGALRLGAAGHYYQGAGLSRTRMYEPRYHIDGGDIAVDYVGVSAEDGHGYGVDLGGALQVHPKLTMSAAVANAFSKMTWSEELRYRHLVIDAAGFEDVAELRDAYESSDRALDPSSSPLIVLRTAEGLYDQAYFPATLRAGLSYAPARRTRLAASYEDQLTDGILGSWWQRTAAVGFEQSLPGFALRGGFASDLADASMLSAGLSLGPIDLGLAKVTDSGTEDTPRDGWIGTIGIGFRGRTR